MKQISEKQKRYIQRLGLYMLVVYVPFLLGVVLFKYPSELLLARMREVSLLESLQQGNYILFKNILYYASGQPTWRVAIYNLAGNIIIFIPLGVLLPVVWSCTRRFWRVVGVGAAVSVVLELSQLVFRIGDFDVDDILLNTFGVALGVGVYTLVRRYFN